MRTNLSFCTSDLVRNAYYCAACLLSAAALLTGCGRAMSGKYANDLMQVEFKSSSRAHLSVGLEGLSRTTTEVKYEVKGDKVTLHNQAGNLILTLNKDGTLSGAPMEALSGPLKKL